MQKKIRKSKRKEVQKEKHDREKREDQEEKKDDKGNKLEEKKDEMALLPPLRGTLTALFSIFLPVTLLMLALSGILTVAK